MDPNVSNQGAPAPSGFDPGQTQYIPVQPQPGYDSPGAIPNPATQPPPVAQYRPGSSYSPYPTYARRNDRDRTLLALILIGGGALALLGQFNIFQGFGHLVVLLIGAGLMYAYFSARGGYRIGFLIPGAILLGVGVGRLISDFPVVGNLVNGSATTVTIGLAFCLIWLLERRHWWALFPGIFMILVGMSSFIGSLWPLLLIMLGVYLLYDRSHKRPVS